MCVCIYGCTAEERHACKMTSFCHRVNNIMSLEVETDCRKQKKSIFKSKNKNVIVFYGFN